MTAGVASAEITMSGYAHGGLKYAGDAAKEVSTFTEIEIDLNASTETDAGLTIGTSMDIDSANGSAASVTDHELFISGAFGTVTIGAVDPATDDIGLSDIGFDGIGVDNVAEDGQVQGTADVRWDYSVGDLGLVATVDLATDDMSVGGSYKFGAVKLAGAYSKNDATGNDSTVAVVSASQGAVSGHVYYGDNDVNGASFGVFAAYKVSDALTVNGAYASTDDTNANSTEDSAYGVGFAYNLGGATLAGGVGKDGNNQSVADLGVKFSF